MVRRALVLTGVTLLLVAAGVGVSACAAESDVSTELNPQPLPPKDDGHGRGSGDYAESPSAGDDTTGGAPTSPSPPARDADGGSDAGADGGGPA